MKDVFPIVPAPAVTLWFVGGLTLFLLAMIALFMWIGWGTRFTTFEVTQESLSIRGDLYGRTIPRTHFRLDEARIINLLEDREHRPVLRTNGAGLPGYASGWFRLANREKALVFLTARDAVVYLPTTDGYSLLLSPREPHQLLAALQANR